MVIDVVDTAAVDGREGEVLRTLPHGTVIIWDPAKARSYPYYKAGHEKFQAGEAVRFLTDATDTVIVSVRRTGGRRRRRNKGRDAISFRHWIGRDW